MISANYITQLLVRLVIVAVKCVIFINVYTTSLLKSSLCLPVRYLWIITKATAFLGIPLYILSKCDGAPRGFGDL